MGIFNTFFIFNSDETLLNMFPIPISFVLLVSLQTKILGKLDGLLIILSVGFIHFKVFLMLS